MERLLQECFFGELAQLGERGLCKPEVRGSIPLFSTRETAALRGGFFVPAARFALSSGIPVIFMAIAPDAGERSARPLPCKVARESKEG